MAKVKFLTGSKGDIDTKISNGLIDDGDMVLTSDTDELVFINPKLEKRIIKSKTQKDYVLQGTSLGGLADGSVIAAGTSIDELLEMITKKVIPPSYNTPKLVLTSNIAETEFEVGEKVNLIFSSTFTKNDAGTISEHKLLQNGNIIYENKSNSLSTEVNDLVLSETKTIFTSQAEHGAGPIKNNNFGEPDSTNAIPQGSLTSNSIEYIGHRKLFFGAGTGDIPELTSENIRALSSSILNPSEEMEFSIDMADGQQYVVIAYPSNIRDIEKITYVQLGDDGMVSSFEQSLVNVEGANGYNPVEYKVYIYKTTVPVVSKMTFKINI